MDSDLLRLLHAPLLWALLLLLVLDYHAGPWGHLGALLRPVFTLSQVNALGVHKVSQTRVYIVFRNRMCSPIQANT